MTGWWAPLRWRLRALFRPQRVQDEIDEELQAHLSLHAEELQRQGLSPREAREEARRLFGNWNSVRGQCHQEALVWDPDAHQLGRWDMIRLNIRYALRSFGRRPGFTAVTVLTLAIGMGAVTAIFSLVDGLLVRPLHYAASEQLVVPYSRNIEKGFDRGPLTYQDFLALQQRPDLFESVAVGSFQKVDLIGEGEPERVVGVATTPGLFEMMRVRPILGRTFAADEFSADSERVVVLSEPLWNRRFGGEPAALGKTVEINGNPFTVIGIARPDDVYPPGAELWVPFRTSVPLPDYLARVDNFFLRGLARLAPGVTLEQAQSELLVVAARLRDEHPALRQGVDTGLTTLKEWVVGPRFQNAVLILMAAVGLLLLIACVNVANLLLARATERQREMAIRRALGAGRRQLLSQLLVESLFLAVAAGLAGLLLAEWGTAVLKSVAPERLPRLAEVAIDGRAFLFSGLLSLGTAVLFGLLPALKITRANTAGALHDSGRTGTPSRSTRRLSAVLVGGQIALSFVLLIASGLLFRSFLQMTLSDPGVRLEKTLSVEVRLPSARYPTTEKADELYLSLLESVKRLPAVQDVAATSMVPLDGVGIHLQRSHLEEGSPEPPAGPEQSADWVVVSDDFFRTLGIPLQQGRVLDDRDHAGAVPTLVINQELARQMFPGQDPIGRRIRSWRDEDLLREIVGVVGNVRLLGLGDEIRPQVYVPHRQVEWPPLAALVVRTDDVPEAIVPVIRQEIERLDPLLPPGQVATLEDLAAASTSREKLNLQLMGVFGLVAVLLAAVGLYGLLSYSVQRRTVEFGVRMALGAGERDVLRMVLRQGLVIAAIGGAAGLALALFVARALRSALFDISPADPLTYGSVVLLLLAIALLASVLPAWRATRVNPAACLRAE